MKIGLVIPTVPGREESLEQVLTAYEETCDPDVEFDVTIREGYPNCGEAWNDGYADVADSDYVFFTLDDLEPRPGWEQVAASTTDAGYIPAPRMLNPDGTVQSCGSMGLGAVMPECPDRTPCRNTGVIFCTPSMFEEVGRFLPIHYAVDDDWNWRAALAGYQVLYRSGMTFTHHNVTTNTDHVRLLAQDHIKEFIKHATTIQLREKVVPA